MEIKNSIESPLRGLEANEAGEPGKEIAKQEVGKNVCEFGETTLCLVSKLETNTKGEA